MSELRVGALALLLALSPAAAAPTLSEAESAALSAGQTTLRWEAGGWLWAARDSSASPEAALAAFLDLPARVGEVDGVQAIELYEAPPAQLGARWTMAVAVYRSSFHIRYEVAGTRCSFSLDPDKDNDLDASEGIFEALPREGGSRMVLRSRSEAGAWAPGWLVRRMSEKSARQTLEGTAARAEG